MTYDEARQKVAESKNFPDWDFMQAAYEGISMIKGEEWLEETLKKRNQEAAERMVNEHVLMGRTSIMVTIMDRVDDSVLNDINGMPVPFPETP